MNRLPDELEELLDEWREPRVPIDWDEHSDFRMTHVALENRERDWRRRLDAMLKNVAEG